MSARPSGFSLIELLVVISIVAVLAALLLPTVGIVRGQSKTVSCANNLKGAGLALTIYAQESDGILPWGEAGPSGYPYSWVSAIGTLSSEEKFPLTCPSAKAAGGTYNYTANLQTLVCRTFGSATSTLKPMPLSGVPGHTVMLFDAGLGQNPNGLNAFYSSMNMGWTFYYYKSTDPPDLRPQPLQSDGGFRVENRHGNNSMANYLFADDHVSCSRPGDLTWDDFRVQGNGRKYY